MTADWMWKARAYLGGEGPMLNTTVCDEAFRDLRVEVKKGSDTGRG